MKKISIVTSCFNEEDNILPLYEKLKKVISNLESRYNFEIIFIDNASNDFTQDELRKIAGEDSRVKLIFNSRNFGSIKSPYYAICQATGDAVIYMASDLQDPPEMIYDFIENWEKGCEVVIARKYDSRKFTFLDFLRRFYYFTLDILKDEDTKLVRNYKGFGLYDKKVITKIKEVNDPYPYFRGAVLDLGYRMKIIDFNQPERKNGVDKQNLLTLWNLGMLGLTRTTKVPIHIITIIGFFGSLISLLLVILSLICYVGYVNFIIPKKMLSLYLLMFIQILSVGLIGEYLIMLCRFAEKKPLVIEKERINF
mgnify:CR=1 FL=1